jgi:hypothetical protein
MTRFDYWAYIFALILHAPVRVEAAVVMPPPEVRFAQQASGACTILSKPLPKVAAGSGVSVKVVEMGAARSKAPSHRCSVVEHPHLFSGSGASQRGGR